LKGRIKERQKISTAAPGRALAFVPAPKTDEEEGTLMRSLE